MFWNIINVNCGQCKMNFTNSLIYTTVNLIIFIVDYAWSIKFASHHLSFDWHLGGLLFNDKFRHNIGMCDSPLKHEKNNRISIIDFWLSHKSD